MRKLSLLQNMAIGGVVILGLVYGAFYTFHFSGSYLAARSIDAAQRGDGYSAIVDINRAIRLNPAASTHRNVRARYYVMADDPERTSREISAMLKAHPYYYRHFLHAGRMTANMGQLQRAEQYYLRAAALVPNSARLHEQVAGFYLDAGQPQAALAHIDKAVELVENSDWAYYSYYLAGLAYTMMGNQEGARLAFIATIAKSNSSSVCYPALIRLVEIMPDYGGETCT